MAPAKPVEGVPRAGAVVVPDAAAAKRLHAKALAGTLEAGGGLRLAPVEAAHCVAAGWLAVRGPAGPLTPAEVAALGPAERAITDHAVYHDLRDRGFVAHPTGTPGRFDVWPRGSAQGPAELRVAAFAAEAGVGAGTLRQAAEEGLVCAVVDADGVVTHYALDEEAPQGERPPGDLPPMDGRVVGGRVLVADAAGGRSLAALFLGIADGDARLLPPLEAEMLRQGGTLRGVPRLDVPQEHVDALRALREAGVVAKSGLRFGTHLRAYKGDPDAEHADWLVHCAARGGDLAWSDLARGVRLAHGVRKRFLVALPAPAGSAVRFVRIAWRRM